MFLSRYFIAALVSVLFALPAVALQLGPLEVNSDFGEPLEASVRLEDSSGLRAKDVSLNFYDYRRAGRSLRPGQVLVFARLRYEISKPGRNQDLRIRFYTNEPLEEARLGFRLQVSSKRGRQSSRRYLHILPGTLVAGSDGAIRDRRRDRQTRQLRKDQGWHLGMASPEDGIVVSSNDYEALWIMAQQLKSGYGISVFQAMLAIFDINRHAFAKDGVGRKNINLLWAGQELRMPSLDEMRSYDRSSSIVEVAKQNYYSGMALPIAEAALKDFLVITATGGDQDTGPLEPWIPTDEDIAAPDLTSRPGLPALPSTDDDEDVLPPDEEAEGGILVYLLVAAAILLLLIALAVLFRRQSGNLAPSASARPSIANQLALLKAHADMKDMDAATELYERIMQDVSLSDGQRHQASALIRKMAGTGTGGSTGTGTGGSTGTGTDDGAGTGTKTDGTDSDSDRKPDNRG